MQQNNNKVSFVFHSTKDLQIMPLGELSFSNTLFLENKEQPSDSDTEQYKAVLRHCKRIYIVIFFSQDGYILLTRLSG